MTGSRLDRRRLPAAFTCELPGPPARRLCHLSCVTAAVPLLSRAEPGAVRNKRRPPFICDLRVVAIYLQSHTAKKSNHAEISFNHDECVTQHRG